MASNLQLTSSIKHQKTWGVEENSQRYFPMLVSDHWVTQRDVTYSSNTKQQLQVL